MILKKKAMAITMNTIIIAIIALIVLLVVALIFKTQIGKISETFLGIEDQAEQEGEEAKLEIEDIFACRDGSTRTINEKEQECNDGKWVET